MPTYFVTITAATEQNQATERRLVQANNKAAALAHVARDRITVTVAQPADIWAMGKEGAHHKGFADPACPKTA